MLNIQINETSCQCEHKGDPLRVAAELAATAGAIYSTYKCVDPRAAELFRLAFIKMLGPESRVWTPGEGQMSICIPEKDKEKGGA